MSQTTLAKFRPLTPASPLAASQNSSPSSPVPSNCSEVGGRETGINGKDRPDSAGILPRMMNYCNVPPLSSFLDGADDERAGLGGGMEGAERASGSAGVEAGSTWTNLSEEGCKHGAWLITLADKTPRQIFTFEKSMHAKSCSPCSRDSASQTFRCLLKRLTDCV